MLKVAGVRLQCLFCCNGRSGTLDQSQESLESELPDSDSEEPDSLLLLLWPAEASVLLDEELELVPSSESSDDSGTL